ncbi:MAG: hypothetical protein JSW00_10685 [Thermoplasmata archaeon]|nr:MAG: hypothetical protein JSW00_10685 [Thermoplasmata archaeon]
MKKKIWAQAFIFMLLISILQMTLPTAAEETPSGWTEDIRITEVEGNSSLRPRIASDSQNNLHVAYVDYRHGPPEIYYMKLDEEGNIIIDETLITVQDAATSYHVDVACDSNDNIHIIWSDIRDTGPVSNIELYYEKLDNMGNTIVDELRITHAPHYSLYPSITVDPSDNLHIVWSEEVNIMSVLQEEIYYTKLDNNGQTLVDDLPLTGQDGEESLFPDCEADSEGNIHVVWLDDRNETGTTKCQDVYYTKLNNNGNTIIDDTKTFVRADHFRPNIVIDSNDLIHLTCGSMPNWKGNVYKQVYYMKLDNDGAPIVDEKRLTNDEENATHPSLHLDSQENVHIVWEDERNQNSEIYYMKVNNEGNILKDELRLTINASKSLFPVVELDHNDKANVVWADGRDYLDGDRMEIYYKRYFETQINIPPTVQITSPFEGQVVEGIVYVLGTAADVDGTIQFVELKIDNGNWIEVQGTSSWNYSLNTTTMDNGPYAIYARSYDGFNYSIEQQVNIIVSNIATNNPPTVSITSPYEGETVSDTIDIQGTAYDTDGTVEHVELRIDNGNWIEVEGTTSWTYPLDTTTMDNGQYTIYVRSYDGLNYSTEQRVNITVNNVSPQPNNPPTVAITSPHDEDTVSGTVIVKGTASDLDGNVQKVQIKIDNKGWFTATGTSSWSFSWDTTSEVDGEHALYARAEDDRNEHSSIISVAVTVDNSINYPPTLEIISPAEGTVSGIVEIAGTASDPDGDGTITSVEVKIEGTWEEAEGTTDWTYNWDTTELDDGEYNISARAFDGTDYSIVEFVIVHVDNPHAPTLSITSYIPEKVSGTITIEGTASDEDGDITQVEIQIDSGSWEEAEGKTGWSFQLDTTELSDGEHTITIRATDDEGESVEETLTIEVDNAEDLSELPLWMLLLLVVILILIVAIIAALIGGISSSKAAGVGSDSEIKQSQGALQSLSCPQCGFAFQADTRSPQIQCPNCGLSGSA